MIRRCPLLAWFPSVALSACIAASAMAQDDPVFRMLAPGQETLMDVEWKLLEAKAREKILAEELAFTRQKPDAAEDKAKQPDANPFAELIRQTLHEQGKKRSEALGEVETKMAGTLADAEKRWKAARAAALAVADMKDAHIWDRWTIAIAAWGCCLFGISLLLAAHGRRRRIRSGLRFQGKMGMAAASLPVLFLLSLAAHALADDLAELDGKNQKAAAEIDKVRQKRLERFLEPFPAGVREDITNAEKDAAERLRKLRVNAELIRLAGTETETNASKHGELLEKIQHNQAGFRSNVGIKMGLCLAFVLLAFVPVNRVARALKKEQEEQAKQCPCCLATGSLTTKTSDVKDRRFPDPTYLQCDEEGCGYELRAGYQRLPRLCFPTVGIRSSGKTHWLVTAYDMIKNTRVPVPASLQTAPSITDQVFDVEIERILESHKLARPTVHSLQFPHPLVFHVKDCDLLGRNEGMLNLFDFAGEMMARHVQTDLLRKRALLMDGFVLFLDPTQVRLGRGGMSIKDQIKALAAFHQEIRDMRGVDVGTPVPVPIAVCISKLDLLVTQNPFGKAAIPWLRTLRESYARPTTLAEIQQRSKLCEQALPTMFPGWTLPRTLNEQFGGRFLFFPLTPVGIAEDELGESDLTRRGFSPVGILEPVLWLMHMHGFNVFG